MSQTIKQYCRPLRSVRSSIGVVKLGQWFRHLYGPSPIGMGAWCAQLSVGGGEFTLGKTDFLGGLFWNSDTIKWWFIELDSRRTVILILHNSASTSWSYLSLSMWSSRLSTAWAVRQFLRALKIAPRDGKQPFNACGRSWVTEEYSYYSLSRRGYRLPLTAQ
jgi:hypothetical protein